MEERYIPMSKIFRDTRYPESLEDIDYDEIKKEHYRRTGELLDNPRDTARYRFDEMIGRSLMTPHQHMGELKFSPIEAILELLDLFLEKKNMNYYNAAKDMYDKLEPEQKIEVNAILMDAIGTNINGIKRMK